METLDAPHLSTSKVSPAYTSSLIFLCLLFIHHHIALLPPIPISILLPSSACLPPNVARHQHSPPHHAHIHLGLATGQRSPAHLSGWHGSHGYTTWPTFASFAFFVFTASCRDNQRRLTPHTRIRLAREGHHRAETFKPHEQLLPQRSSNAFAGRDAAVHKHSQYPQLQEEIQHPRRHSRPAPPPSAQPGRVTPGTRSRDRGPGQ